MRGMWKIFRRIPFIESLISFVGQLGLSGYIQAAGAVMIAVFWAGWGWLESHLPHWGVALLFLVILTVVVFFINQGIELFRKAKAEKIDIDKLADELIAISDQITRTVNDYIRDRERLSAAPEEENSGRIAWERRIREGEHLTRHVSEKYGSRIMAATLLLSKLDVKIPFHLSHMSEHTIMGLASYFGAVGHLLKSGNISAAQSLDDGTGRATGSGRLEVL